MATGRRRREDKVKKAAQIKQVEADKQKEIQESGKKHQKSGK